MVKKFQQLAWKNTSSYPEKIPAAFLKKYQQLAWKNTSSFPEKIPAAFLKKYQQLSSSLPASYRNQANQINQTNPSIS
jgi:hypothetical protein